MSSESIALRYVYPSEIETFGGVEARQKLISTGRIGRTWAGNYTTALRLPLHPSMGAPNTPYPVSTSENENAASSYDNDDYIEQGEYHPLSHAALSFVHGGLSPTYSNLAPFPTRINELSASLLRKLQHRKQPPPHPPYPYPGLPPGMITCPLTRRPLNYWLSGTTEEEDELYSSNGPLWYRGWALHSEEQVCEQVKEVLRKTGTRRMIMGHTPDFDVRYQMRSPYLR